MDVSNDRNPFETSNFLRKEVVLRKGFAGVGGNFVEKIMT